MAKNITINSFRNEDNYENWIVFEGGAVPAQFFPAVLWMHF